MRAERQHDEYAERGPGPEGVGLLADETTKVSRLEVPSSRNLLDRHITPAKCGRGMRFPRCA